MFPLLHIKNLSIDFKAEAGSASAVQNISFKINNGEIVAIVGESGSGKTVTSLSVLQLLPAPPAVYKTGEILFSKDGNEQVDLLKISEGQMTSIRGNSISIIFQEPMTSLNPVKKCGNQVMETIFTHKHTGKSQAKKHTLELFENVGLSKNVFNAYPHQLSGGQKQRVIIAMAISCAPSLLIADEPTTALDVIVQKKILQLIKKLQQQFNMGVIYITHDLGLVSEIADKVLVMYRGFIVETGTVQKIFTQAEHPYTKALLACRPVLYSKPQRLPLISDFIQERKSKLNYEPAAISNIKSGLKNIALKDNNLSILLEVKNLNVSFINKNFWGKTKTEFKAVNDVSFAIKRGETVGLAGESGCGKTTLGRALIRMIEPTSGNVFFKGTDIANISKEEMRTLRKKIQIIFQDPYGSLNPRITIGSALQEPLKAHGLLKNNNQRREKVMELLHKVNLRPEHFNRYPHEFSGGQRQRICIARALGLSPEFIICDESVSALDVSVQAQVLNLLNDLKTEFGFTTIFISHDLSVLHYLSDRILIMNKGKIVESGTAEDIWQNPKTEYTKNLLASIPGKIFYS